MRVPQTFVAVGGTLFVLGVGVAVVLYSPLASHVQRAATPAAASGALVSSSTLSGVTVDAEVIAQHAPPPLGYESEYHNTLYGFSFNHTPEGSVKEYDEGNGAMTIVLENEKRVRGMQVFIVPYNEPLITEERFHADVPSGVRENVEETVLDGVRAVTFTSYDAGLGETREIWAIRNGFLYEITTFKGVGNWFTPIVQSWRFL